MAATQAPKKRNLVKGARTRSFIKDAALGLYARKNGEDITLAEICDATGLTVGAFYFHFDGKDQVLEEIAIDACREYHAAVLADMEGATDLYVLFYRILYGYYQGYIRNPIVSRLMYTVIMRSDVAYSFWLESRSELLGRLQAAISAGRSARGLSTEMDEFTSNWLISAVEDFVWDVFMSRGNLKLNQLAASPDVFVRQQAILWYRAALGEDPDHPMARSGPARNRAKAQSVKPSKVAVEG